MADDDKSFERQQRHNRLRLSGLLAGAVYAELERENFRRTTKGQIA